MVVITVQTEGTIRRPRMRLHRSLCRHGRTHGFLRAREHGKEGIPLPVYFLTAVFLNGGTEQTAVFLQDFRIPPVDKALEQLCGTLDVG